LLFEMTMKKIKLFDYQEDMVKRVQEAFKHHDAVMVQMPTGTGKTMVLANIVFSFLEKSNNPIWIVAHRRELVSQIKGTLNKSLLIFSNHPVPLSKEGLSKITPSLFTIKEGSTSHPGPLTLRGEGGNRPPRCSEPLRSKVGGPSKVSPDCAGWDRLGATCLHLAERVGDGLGATSASSVNPASDMMPIKVMSIQWLSKHYREMEEKPGLIVIDEAHHALAETYAEVMNAYPKAKKLGLTATPYRLNGKGFTDLFDTLLCSWSMEKFIAEGRLSLYDYYSIKPDSAAQLLIDSLQKRGADGDYQQKELNEVMDVKPSLEMLCLTIKKYVPGKKGIVYAISIQHAEHIAEFYRENGIKAVAISSKTPLAERQELIERFKSSSLSSSLNSSSDDIEVLVSVDLFSEGFDCPDVEFIQLARPTLSLAKYMQMVGRGLRVAEGKEYCVILDNVGLYKRFGLPSVDRDWQSMFEGRTSLEDILQEACMQVNSHNCRMDLVMDGDEEMMKIINHERQQQMIMDTYGYQIVEDEKGLKGIKDKEGKMILECQYKKIEVTNDGFAYCYIRKKVGRKEWIDLRNRLWFANKPQSVKLMGIDFCTEDGKKLYPRIQSKYIDEKTYLTVKTLELQVGTGLSWKHRFIPWDEPNKVYMCQERKDRSRLYVDENKQYFVQKNIGSQLVEVNSPEGLAKFAEKDKQERENDAETLKNAYPHYEFYPVDKVKFHMQIHRNNKCENKIRIEKDGIWHVEDDWYHESYWVDPITHRKHYTRPVLFKRGYLNILKEGDWCYVRNIPGLRNRPLRQWEIVADDNICVINNKYLIEKSEPDQWYKICRRTDDFTYFSVLACFYESEHIKDDTEIQITQFDGEGLKMTQEGFPYTPLVIKTYKRSRWL
jgi:superfamily II DNA or RNA helicase